MQERKEAGIGGHEQGQRQRDAKEENAPELRIPDLPERPEEGAQDHSETHVTMASGDPVAGVREGLAFPVPI